MMKILSQQAKGGIFTLKNQHASSNSSKLHIHHQTHKLHSSGIQAAVFRARVMEKKVAHYKRFEGQVMNKKMNSNSMEHVQKQHFSSNSRKASSSSGLFRKISRSVVLRSCFELKL